MINILLIIYILNQIFEQNLWELNPTLSAISLLTNSLQVGSLFIYFFETYAIIQLRRRTLRDMKKSQL